MKQTIFENLPEFYRDLLPDIFFDYVPKESLINCQNCIMCDDYLEKKRKGERYFIPETKCCSYFPELPNYLLGAILSKESENMPEGKERLKKIIQEQVGVTPLFLFPSNIYTEKYDAFVKIVYGKSVELRCPFFAEESGACTIYPYWNSVCSSYFCKSVGNKEGEAFWESRMIYMGNIERTLASYALEQLGLDVLLFQKKKLLRLDNNKGEINPEEYKKLWGDWVGKEADFYMKTFEVFSNIDKTTFNRLTKKHEKLVENLKTKRTVFLNKCGV